MEQMIVSDANTIPRASKADPWVAIRRRLRLLIKLLIVAAAVAAVVYWTRFAPVAVRAYSVHTSELVAEVAGTGTLEAHVKTVISSKIAGRIASVSVDQGDRVSAGQVLVRLDDSDLQQQVEIAQATVDAARAAIDRLTADRDRAAAILAQARRDYKRLQNLLTRGSASSVEFDKAVEALSIAEAELARARAAIVEGRKQLRAAEKTLLYQQARLADTVIDAPFDGLIVRRSRDPGDVVVPGSEILYLISTAEMWVRAWVDETAMARLEPKQPARVVFRSEPRRSYEGQVVRLGREVDRETREFIVDVLVKTLPENWAVGQRAEVYIETARKRDATLLPANLIVRQDGQVGVFVLDGDRAAWRPVEVGLRGAENVEIISGLTPGEKVVTPVKEKTALRAGRRVKVQ